MKWDIRARGCSLAGIAWLGGLSKGLWVPIPVISIAFIFTFYKTIFNAYDM